MNPSTVAKAYLVAREALEVAEKAKAEAEAILKEALARAGVDFAIADGMKVTVVQGERPAYDAEALRDLVSPAVFKKVTKSAIDGKKFKSAIEVGVIKSDVADAVTKVTAYEQVRVTDLNKAEATKEVKATKVA
jgi:PP-loop superfamily ATP-utilizing enzyme